MTHRLFITLVLVAVAMTAQAQHLKDIPKFEIAVALIKKYEGWHGHPKHHPYVGYGHKVLPHENYTHRITRRQADALLRSDLRNLCSTFRNFGKDSLLLATLAYNVGSGRFLGYGKHRQSRLICKLKSGDRNIYKDYISFRCWNGRKIPSIERRRKMEYLLLFER